MQTSFFDLDKRLASLSSAGDPLECLNAAIDWSIFTPVLAKLDVKERKSRAGRRPTCRILMFKMLILQQMYALSDERLEFQVTDRLSFMRFLGLGLARDVPDARTVWAFREALKTRELHQALFDRFHQALAALGVELKSGQIMDATLVPVPVQHNRREDNDLLKVGALPLHWQDQQAKRRQKDTEARWTRKNHVSHFGYKNHINIDRDSKLIHKAVVTPANVADVDVQEDILCAPERAGPDVHKDAGYVNAAKDEAMTDKGWRPHTNEKGERCHPLSEAQKQSNRIKSRTRARVEHVFGAMENDMGGIGVRSIGLKRAQCQLVLKNLAYNLKRTVYLLKAKFWKGIDRIGAPKTSPVPAMGVRGA